MKRNTQGNKGFRAPLRRPLSLVLLGTLAVGCSKTPPTSPADSSDSTVQNASEISSEQAPPVIRQFCGDCHALPSPASFPKDLWHEEVQRGFNFYYASNSTDLTVPKQSEVAAWYRENAPEKFAVHRPELHIHPTLSFQERPIPVPNGSPTGITGVSFVTGDPVRNDIIWCSDMLTGAIRQITLDGETLREYGGLVRNPVSIRFVDLDQNQQLDLVIADLGSPLPADHDEGQVVWIPNYEHSSEATAILKGKGRISDVQPADFDQDGDIDFIVSEFGWHTTGGIHLLRNDTTSEGKSEWTTITLDSRPGTIHTPVIDLNSDGLPDFVALISQEHEVIECFLNKGGTFEKQRLYSAPDPSWGSSGIELIDFDKDGDPDILYTNGDTFDSKLVKPYHSIWLLRNNGRNEFTEEKVADLPGVHRALVFDPDRDGDFDIAACALLPRDTIEVEDKALLQSLIWLEQTDAGSFRRHSIQTGQAGHAAMLIHQKDSESPLGIMVGCFSESGTPKGTLLQVFRLNADSSPAPLENR